MSIFPVRVKGSYYRMNILENVSLKPYNTFGINAYSRYFVEVTEMPVLLETLEHKKFQDTEKLILGGGSNVLLTRDFPGVVIKNSLKGIEVVKEDDDLVFIKAQAGEVWHDLVLFCIKLGYAGIENLSLIPGLVGAAPMQNIGAYGVELESVFVNLEATHLRTGESRTFNKTDCAFGYRYSVFKGKLKGEYIITSVTLRLNKTPTFNVSYGAIRETLEKMQVKELSIKAISDAVISIRRSKLPDPKEIGNAGSFFKNPEISTELFETLQSKYPAMPHYPLPNGKIKVPAGWLIEQCGWKGKRIGNTGSHRNQALVLVNYGNATGKEIKDLAFKIQASVREKFEIELSPEVNII